MKQCNTSNPKKNRTVVDAVESKPRLQAVPVKRDNIEKFAPINVRGLANDVKIGSVVEAFEALRLDALCL